MIEVEAYGLSNSGPNRSRNEDMIGSFAPADNLLLQRKGHLFVVADGVGGHRAGDIASTIAVEAVIREFYSPSNHSRVEPALRHALQTANLRVYDLAQRNPDYRSMATTLTVLALAGAHAYLGHIGDSRVYLWRSGQFTQLTVDHSEVAELVRMRVVSAGRVREHPSRSVLTRTLGNKLIVRPDFLRCALAPGDQFILCTDGLWSEVSENEMAAILASDGPQSSCRSLIDLALQRDCSDNVSVQVVKVNAVETTAAELEAGASRGGLLSGIMQLIGRT